MLPNYRNTGFCAKFDVFSNNTLKIQIFLFLFKMLEDTSQRILVFDVFFKIKVDN